MPKVCIFFRMWLAMFTTQLFLYTILQWIIFQNQAYSSLFALTNLYYCLALQYSLKKFFQFYRKTSTFFSSIHDHFFFLSTEPVVRLSHRTDFVVAGMDKSTRAICFVSGQEFIGWFKSTGEQIIGTSPNHRMYVEDEDDSYSLVIRRLMQSDGGEYVCRGTKTSATYSLYVECKCCMV